MQACDIELKLKVKLFYLQANNSISYVNCMKVC